jgi:hypothetical protein
VPLEIPRVCRPTETAVIDRPFQLIAAEVESRTALNPIRTPPVDA